MKKSFLIIILTISLVFNAFSNLAMAQTTTNESNSSSSQIFQDVKNLAKEKVEKMTDLKRGEATGKIKAWFSQRKEAIKIGWQEEKQDFKGGVKGILSDVWNKIKNLVGR